MGGDDGEQPQSADSGLIARNVPLVQELVLRLFLIPDDVAVFVPPSGGRIVVGGVRRRRWGQQLSFGWWCIDGFFLNDALMHVARWCIAELIAWWCIDVLVALSSGAGMRLHLFFAVTHLPP